MGPSIIEVFFQYYDIFLKGALGTLKISAIAVASGTICGTVISLMSLSKNKLVKTIAAIYVNVLRGTPLLVQMYIAYYFIPMAIPALNGVSKETFVMLALILNSSAYVSEIIRGGIVSVDAGQFEAARSLGMSMKNCMTRIVFPQAIKNILPSLANEYIAMIKETSLAGTFMMYDLMFTKTLLANKFLVWQPLFIIAIIYLLMTLILSYFVKLLERKLASNE